MVRVSVVAMLASLGVAGASLAYAQPQAAAPAQGVETAAAQQAATAPAGNPTKGRELFETWACGACHTLTDAGATSPVGPSLDRNPNLNHDLIVNRITNGSGQMPAFGGQMTEQEIQDTAAYILKAAAK